MRATILLIASILCGCASSAVVPRPLHQVESRVHALWDPRKGPAHDLLTQSLQGGGQNGVTNRRSRVVIDGRVVEGAVFTDASGRGRVLDLNPVRASADPLTWALDPDLRFQTAGQTEQSWNWRLEKWNLANSFPMPEGHATIEASALGESQTRVRVKCWDNGLLFDSRNRNRERAMLERLADAEPK